MFGHHLRSELAPRPASSPQAVNPIENGNPHNSIFLRTSAVDCIPLSVSRQKNTPLVKNWFPRRSEKNPKLKLRGWKRYASHRLGQTLFYLFLPNLFILPILTYATYPPHPPQKKYPLLPLGTLETHTLRPPRPHFPLLSPTTPLYLLRPPITTV